MSADSLVDAEDVAAYLKTRGLLVVCGRGSLTIEDAAGGREDVAVTDVDGAIEARVATEVGAAEAAADAGDGGSTSEAVAAVLVVGERPVEEAGLPVPSGPRRTRGVSGKRTRKVAGGGQQKTPPDLTGNVIDQYGV